MSRVRRGSFGSVSQGQSVASFSASSSMSKSQYDEEMGKIQQDTMLINQKIAAVNGDPVPTNFPPSISSVASNSKPTTQSPFVAGIRGLSSDPTAAVLQQNGKRQQQSVNGINSDSHFAAASAGASPLLLHEALSELLRKMCEFDRLVLKKTAPVETVPHRRNSRGSDLLVLPTHLHITDRLLDLHTQSKRVTVIRTHETSDGSGGGKLSSRSSDEASSTNASSVQEITDLKKEIAAIKRQLSESKNDAATERMEVKKVKSALAKAETEVKSQKALLEKEKNAIKDAVADASSELRSKLQQVEVEAKQCKNECAGAQKQSEALSEEVAVLRRQLEKERQSAKEALLRSTTEITEHTERNIAQQRRMNDAEAQVARLQELLEVETARYNSIVNLLLLKAARIQEGKELDGSFDDCINLPSDVRNAFHILESALSERLDSARKEVELILSLKEVLEHEVQNSNAQRDIMNKDNIQLKEQYDTLRVAYQSLESEHYAVVNNKKQQQDQQQDQNKSEKDELNSINMKIGELESELVGKDREINELRAQLFAANRREMEFQMMPNMLAELQMKIRQAEDGKSHAEASLRDCQEELEAYKKIAEKLKQKIRDLSKNVEKPENDFLDTFEEVMREEMMAMKQAFESKLRAARESADATSKKHQQEIYRLQSRSPMSISTSSSTSLPFSAAYNALAAANTASTTGTSTSAMGRR